MKKFIVFCVLAIAGMQAPAMAGNLPGTGIAGTFHDLSITRGLSSAFGDVTEQSQEDRVCVYCHTPHNAMRPDETQPYLPLWNRVPSSNTIFQMYTNGSDRWQSLGDPTSAAMLFTGAYGIPGPPSMLCLSCHDGSVAVSAYGLFPSGSMGSRNGRHMIGRGQIGYAGDLRNHHPIGFDYNYAYEQNPGLQPSTMQLLGPNPYGLTINDLLWYGRVECTTCHDVHNANNQGYKFTWVRDWQSQFCLSCHIK